MKKFSTIISAMLVSGCTSVTVKPLDASYNVKGICIRENPKVMVEDLMPVITDALTRHNIKSELIASNSEHSNTRHKSISC